MRRFFWKDKTGRGFTNILTMEDLLEIENDSDWNDEELHDFAELAEIGDRWENREHEITLIEVLSE